MSRWVPNGEAGVSVIWIRKFLKGQGQVIFATIHHGVKPQANKCFGTKLDINEHFSSGVMSKQSGHCFSCHHDFVWVHHLFGWNANDTLIGSSPHRVCAISATPGGGHRALWSNVDWCGIHSQCGFVGASAFAVACTAVAVGWPLLWVTDRDPIRWVLLFVHSSLGTPVGWLSLTMVRLFPSIWMVPWSWRYPLLWRWWVAPSSIRALVHFLPGGKVGQGLGEYSSLAHCCRALA